MSYKDLHLNSLKLSNFKNYETISLEFSKQLNCFVGDNGMGKTNLLDAIHLLCLSKSHFLSSDQYLVKTSNDFYRIEGLFYRSLVAESIVIKYKLKGKKQIERNKIAYKKTSEHVGLLPLVIIAPDDIQIIMQGSEDRRKFLDQCLSQIDREYLSNLLHYNTILDQRNALLKKAEDSYSFDETLLSIYDSQLINPANYILSKRKEFIEILRPIFIKLYAAISGERELVDLEYHSQLLTNDLSSLLNESRKKDIILQRTTKGIHKDDVELLIKGQSLKRYASQGQLKSFLLALKLAEYELLRSTIGFSPILLLDDIFDKLDETRVSYLMKILLKNQYGQIFITDTHESRISDIVFSLNEEISLKKFHIKDARLIDEKNSH